MGAEAVGGCARKTEDDGGRRGRVEAHYLCVESKYGEMDIIEAEQAKQLSDDENCLRADFYC